VNSYITERAPELVGFLGDNTLYYISASTASIET
jgi:hypothetical protein